MSIKKEVQLATNIYTIYSSEKQERMKVYFQLNQEYNQCMSMCPRTDVGSEKECDKQCSLVYDKYALLLADRYKDQPEKLKEVVKDSQIFTTERRSDRQGLYYNLNHREVPSWSDTKFDPKY